VFKIVISDKNGKAYQIEKDVPTFIGMRIGQDFDGSLVGLTGYKLQLTGGSDKEGFPMRRDLDGMIRRKALLTGGVGYKSKKKGVKKRKTIRGNRIGEDIVQVNVKVVEKKKDAKKIEDILGVKKEEEVKEETKKEPEKVEPKNESVEKEKKEEPKKEEKKQEEKVEEAKKAEEKEEEKGDKKEEPKKEEKKPKEDEKTKEKTGKE